MIMKNKTQIPVSKKWDYELSYEELKAKAICALYFEDDQYPVRIVLEQGERNKGVFIGTSSDGIVDKGTFSAPRWRGNEYPPDQIDDMVSRFLVESDWWDGPARAVDSTEITPEPTGGVGLGLIEWNVY